MIERKGLQTFKGAPLTLTGSGIAKVGGKAPDFSAAKNLLEKAKLSDYLGKKVVISSVPSIDTPVCSVQTARFNKEASARPDVVVLTVSVDLPFAQARWCGANDAKAVVLLSDWREGDFGKKFGLSIKENGLLARAVYVIDEKGFIKYEQIVPELATEPDYDAVLAAL